MTNQRLSELRHKGHITDAEYKEIKNALSVIEDIKREIEDAKYAHYGQLRGTVIWIIGVLK